ncbi:MAG: hypothetical protein QOJ08_1961 [Ilumatobacteraceae bacterium]
MNKHPLRATFEHFDEPMSADFRQTLRARLLADLDKAEGDAVTRQQPDNATLDVDDIQEVTVLKKIDRSKRPQSRSQILVAIAAATIIAVGVAALVVNKRNADEHVATNDSSVSVSPGTVDTTPATTVAVPASNHNVSLRGVWTTGAIPVDQITQAMLRAGVTQEIVDAWVLEVGSATEYTFTADVSCCDQLRLRLVDPPVNGAATDKAVLARLTALYTSRTFERNPY